MTASTELKEYVDELTKCPICLEDLVNSRSLPCLHTFCLQCIKDHCRDNSPGDQVKCPVCRSPFVIPVGGVEQLPHNFFLKGLTDVKKVSDTPAETIPCGGCYDDSEDTASSITPATMHCTGCGQNLCKPCSRPHKNIPGGGHEVVQLGSELKSEVLMSLGNFCRQHPLNRLEIYCIECNENMCNTCCHSNKHKKHEFQVINEAYKEFRDTIERDVQLVLEKEKSLQGKLAAIQTEQQLVVDCTMKNESEISRLAGEIQSHVNDAVNNLILRLSNEKTEVIKVATTKKDQCEFELAAFQSFTRYSSELVKRGKPCDITHAYIELHTRAGELLQREVKTDDYQLTASTVSPDELFDGIFDWISTRSPKHINKELTVTSSIQKLEKERDALKDELLKLTTKYDVETVELMKLKKEVIDVEAERDAAIQQQASSEIKLKQLENENNNIRQERDIVKEQLSKLTAEGEVKVKQLEREKVELTDTNEKQVKQLEGLKDAIQHTNTGLRFLTAPDKVKLIHSTNEDKPIFGLTTLNNELYLHYRGNTDITVYDTETYSVQRSLRVPRLGNVSDMTSCKRHQCIYIADHVNNVVHRVDYKNTITQWPVNDVPSGLSVNSVYNVLVTCDEVGKVKEFTTDGKLIREISLESSIVHPWHTVELTTGQLVVCHGGVKDAVHRVCIVDLSGRVLQSYGGSRGSGREQLYVPVRLAVKVVIFVADLNNHRVLMLSPTLSLIREVVSGLRGPLRIWFDDETGRLFVGDNKWENSKYVSGQVKVYGL